MTNGGALGMTNGGALGMTEAAEGSIRMEFS